MPDTAYDAPVFHDGIWYPTRNTRVSGKLVSVTGVAYEFAPDRVIPHLNLIVGDDQERPEWETAGLEARRVIEVHCFPERLLKEVEAVRPREGEDVEISTGPELSQGFLTYVVSAGGRWSTAEHWAPEEASVYCAFGAQHLYSPQRAAEKTGTFQPVTASKSATDSTGARPFPTPVPTHLEQAGVADVKPEWPGLIGGSALFTPENA